MVPPLAPTPPLIFGRRIRCSLCLKRHLQGINDILDILQPLILTTAKPRYTREIKPPRTVQAPSLFWPVMPDANQDQLSSQARKLSLDGQKKRRLISSTGVGGEVFSWRRRREQNSLVNRSKPWSVELHCSLLTQNLYPGVGLVSEVGVKLLI